MTGPRGVRLLAVAGHLPSRVLTNDDLVDMGLDTSDEWIAARTGIRSRRIAASEETVVDLAAAAAAKALADAGIDGADVDLTILATCTMPTSVPGGAAALAHRLGGGGGAFDINAGCSGSSYALAVAADAIRAGSARTAVVVGAERLSGYIDYTDRSTAILFGDGAGAFVLTADDDADRRDIGPVSWGSDGAAYTAIIIPPGKAFIEMDGQAVFRWATTTLAPVALQACERAGVSVHELAGFVPHQANLRIVDSMVRSLGIDETRTAVSRDVVFMGNTSAASIPLALSNLLAGGAVPSGAPVLLIGFGAGLAMAAQVIRVP